ncbi:hypothetical protein [Mucilaginibacter sp. 10I4]|uniref:hypothetical protein n=1 Tax=Mucilaginibacter sp. 10I4 TaxID=3048580 RepID=UPI002B23942C|nr:hypothetical protein [Mucilaginibacter sp. 10I4]MEB0262293.1 hypothetical protein [Mucilaginibacter sp. 10I4]
MAVRYDLFLVGNDLYIDPNLGDFDIQVSDVQHVQDTISAFPGWWKQNPPDGVGVFAYQNSSGQNQILARNMVQQLQSDNYQCNNPIIKQLPNGSLNINPNIQ